VGLALPLFTETPGYGLSAVLESQEMLDRLVGAWWFFALFAVNAIFHTILGEEFLFRGVLLPKMEGVFGRWSWVANGVLFGFYHLHQPWCQGPSLVASSYTHFQAGASVAPGWALLSTLLKVCTLLS
jgi:membrane protease YdiL (CAAX protease family)